MAAVILVIHILIAVALVATVLLQRSEGGALGIGGGGGGGGGFMSGRGTANLLTRTTTILAAAFFATSIGLTILANNASAPTSVLDGVQQPQSGTPQGTPGNQPVLPVLPPDSSPPTPQVPSSQ